MDRTQLKDSSDVENGNMAMLMKSGEVIFVSEFTGGGIMIGENSGGYEVSFIDKNGEHDFRYQADIAAVLDLNTHEQLEFGNPWISGHPSQTAIV